MLSLYLAVLYRLSRPVLTPFPYCVRAACLNPSSPHSGDSGRWMTLLLSQEFTLPDVIRIWDSLFADEHRFSFLTEVCCAMMV